MLHRVIICVCTLLVAVSASAQDVMTADQAIELALMNNYDVQMAHNDAEAARLANTIGNAGMLPRLSATLTDNFSVTHLDQKYADNARPEVHTNNVTGNTLLPSINLSWTLFDGFKMFATKGKLKQQAEIGQLNLKDTLQTTVAQVLNAYYDVVSTQQQLRSVGEAIRVYEETVKLAEAQFNVGTASKVPYLQARVDLNAYKSSALTQRTLVDQKKATLNLLLSRLPETEFNVEDTIIFDAEPKLLDPNQLDKNNFQVMVAQKNIAVSKFAKREVFSQMLPSLLLGAGSSNTGYSFSRTQSTAGLYLYNQSYGPNVGFTLGVPLFNGLVYIHQNQIAKLSVLNAEAKYNKILMQNKVNFYTALRNFQSAKAVLLIENESVSLSRENSTIALERFRLSQSTALELRQAQQSYVDAMTRQVTARYNAKTAETELLRVQGALVK